MCSHPFFLINARVHDPFFKDDFLLHSSSDFVLRQAIPSLCMANRTVDLVASDFILRHPVPALYMANRSIDLVASDFVLRHPTPALYMANRAINFLAHYIYPSST